MPASAHPGHDTAGLHTRAGNSMGRTRESLLDGALTVIERDGLRGLTMAAVASRAGVAKATLYNHFRTKDDVVAALVLREVELVGEAAARVRVQGRTAALEAAATAVAEHVAGRWLAQTDPGALVPVLRLQPSPAARRARELATELVGGSGGSATDADDIPDAPDPAGSEADAALVDLVLRWLVSQLLDPQPADERRATARLLVSDC